MIGDTDYYKCLDWIEKKEERGIRNTDALEKWLKESINRFISQLEYGSTIDIDTLISDMRKQDFYKECKPIEFSDEFENQVSHLLASVLNGEHEYSEGFVKYAAQSLLGYAKKEQEPTDKSHIDCSYIGECPKEDEYESIENGDATGWRRKQKTPHFNTYEEFCEYYKDYYVCSRELFELGARNVGAPKMKPRSEISHTQWKPSKEQLDALKEASASWMNQDMGNCELLESLYNDLKKLM